MAELPDPVEEHLLLREEPATGPKRITAARKLVKWVLEVAIGLIFAAWVAIIFLIPLNPVAEFLEKWFATASKSIYGTTGWLFSIFLLLSPWLF